MAMAICAYSPQCSSLPPQMSSRNIHTWTQILNEYSPRLAFYSIAKAHNTKEAISAIQFDMLADQNESYKSKSALPWSSTEFTAPVSLVNQDSITQFHKLMIPYVHSPLDKSTNWSKCKRILLRWFMGLFFQFPKEDCAQ